MITYIWTQKVSNYLVDGPKINENFEINVPTREEGHRDCNSSIFKY